MEMNPNRRTSSSPHAADSTFKQLFLVYCCCALWAVKYHSSLLTA